MLQVVPVGVRASGTLRIRAADVVREAHARLWSQLENRPSKGAILETVRSGKPRARAGRRREQSFA
jgi:hypothetical protein